MPTNPQQPRTARWLLVAGCALVLAWSTAPAAFAQAAAAGQQLADEALANPEPVPVPADASPPILSLFVEAGWLMVPIVLMSVFVGAVAIERALGLRRSRVRPRRLERGLRQLAEVGDFDPRTAYRLCRERPSSLSRVVSAMLAGAGRPHTEIVASAAEAAQREADRMYSRVRTLNLAAAVTPLMGLLGTVWGMIDAFFATASLPLGSNKGQVLAGGIYLALVTTFAGLAVAIPAAVLAHYFEGRILKITRAIEELIAELLPRMERFEGGPRLDPARLAANDPPLRAVVAEEIDTEAADAGWPHPGAPPPHTPPEALKPEQRTQPWQT